MDMDRGPLCDQCPRRCAAVRASGQLGYCGVPAELRVARIAPHHWEEPSISGTAGAGTVFFTGCNLRCVFCQNRTISQEGYGTSLSEDELIDRILRLADSGVHCLDLVTPSQYTSALVRVLEKIRPRLTIPIVWNSGGYESVDSLRRLDGLVDIYLPDYKYASSALASALSNAPDLPEVTAAALTEMYRQTGPVRFASEQGREGLLRRGVLIRHLVLPGCRRDSMDVLDRIATLFPPKDVLLSLMRQYTPDYLDPAFTIPTDLRARLEAEGIRPALHRRLTEFEYRSVLDRAGELGLVGYRQGREAARAQYTPDFGDGTISRS